MLTRDIEVVAGLPISEMFVVDELISIDNTRVASQVRERPNGGCLIFDFAPYMRFVSAHQMSLYVPGSQTARIRTSGYWDVLLEGAQIAVGRLLLSSTVSNPARNILLTSDMDPVIMVDYDTYKYITFEVRAPIPDDVSDALVFGSLPRLTLYVKPYTVTLNSKNGIQVETDVNGQRWIVGHPFIPLDVWPGTYPYVLSLDTDDGSRTIIHAGMIRIRELGVPQT